MNAPWGLLELLSDHCSSFSSIFFLIIIIIFYFPLQRRKRRQMLGGALLFVVFTDLFIKMNLEVLDFFRGRKFREVPLRKLMILLLSVNAVLDDAEEKELTKPGAKSGLMS